MVLTLGQWIFVGIMAVVAVCLIGYFCYQDEPRPAVLTFILALVIIVVFIIFNSWYNTSTANGARNYKDYKSNIENGLDRSVDIYAEDGRQIYHYDGKIDIEDNNGYILFEDENHKRHIIYYGALDTVIIEEK